MPWTKKEIQIENIPGLINTFQTLIKDGHPTIETFRCMYQLENEAIFHMLTVFDFLDNLPKEKIVKFILYQMVN